MKTYAGSLYSTCCTPRKLRRLRGLVLGKSIVEALSILAVGQRSGSKASIKLLKSVASQAAGVPLKVVSFDVGEGPKRRSFMPRAQGRAGLVLKRTSHLKIVLG